MQLEVGDDYWRAGQRRRDDVHFLGLYAAASAIAALPRRYNRSSYKRTMGDSFRGRLAACTLSRNWWRPCSSATRANGRQHPQQLASEQRSFLGPDAP